MSSTDKHQTLLEWVNIYLEEAEIAPAPSFSSLSEITHLYNVLYIAAPNSFNEKDSLNIDAQENWVLKKSNLETLLRAMNEFATVFLSDVDSFDMFKVIDATVIAKQQDDGKQLEILCEYVVTLAILSNNSAILSRLRHMAKDRQQQLSASTKRVMHLHSLRKATSLVAGSIQRSLSPNVSPTSSTVGGQRPIDEDIKAFDVIRNNEDPAKLRSEIGILRNELRDKNSALHLAGSKLEMAEGQLEQLQRRYRTLLEQSESKGPSIRERELHTTISQRDEKIAQLNGFLDDLQRKNRTLTEEKEEMDDFILDLNKKLEDTKVALRIKKEEEMDALTKLSIAEDRAEVNIKRREELEAKLVKLEDAAVNNNSFRRSYREDGDEESMESEEIQRLTMELEELDAKLKRSENEISMMKAMGMTALANDQEKIDHIMHSEEQIKSLRKQLEESDSKMKHLEAQLAETRENHSHEVENYERKIELARRNTAEAAKGVEAEETEKVKNALLAENEKLKRHLAVANEKIEEMERNLLSSGETKAQLQSLRQTLEAGRQAMRKEQSVVTSLVFQYGQRNLALQQRNLLGGTSVPNLLKHEPSMTVFTGGTYTNVGKKAAAHQESLIHAFEHGRSVFDDNSTDGVNPNRAEGETFLNTHRMANNLWGKFVDVWK
eukprot:Tbor_TRINITY_DN4286_c0_g1::TRINITY_DN4286_c0_g1_i1::g.23931::m.23931